MILDIKINSSYYNDFLNVVITYKEYKKTIELSNSHSSIQIIDSILNSIFEEFKHTKCCPLYEFKKYYDYKKFPYCDDMIRETEFYKKHKKNMDKILESEHDMNKWFPVYVTANASTATTTPFTINTNNISVNTGTVGTINVAYPAQYIRLDLNLNGG